MISNNLFNIKKMCNTRTIATLQRNMRRYPQELSEKEVDPFTAFPTYYLGELYSEHNRFTTIALPEEKLTFYVNL